MWTIGQTLCYWPYMGFKLFKYIFLVVTAVIVLSYLACLEKNLKDLKYQCYSECVKNFCNGRMDNCKSEYKGTYFHLETCECFVYDRGMSDEKSIVFKGKVYLSRKR